MLYQLQNSVGADRYEGILYDNFSFIPHLHRHYELAVPMEGEILLTAEGREELLSPGRAALILPNQIHAYRSASRSRVWISVFSGDLIPDADAQLTGRAGVSSAFDPEQTVLAYAFPRLLDGDLNRHALRARLAALCACYLETVPLTDRPADASESPAHRMLEYVHLHFREDVTLRGVAALLGYDPAYLSRCFHHLTRMNFRSLLNACRVDYARGLMRTGGLTLTQIALESGFQSVRTFNRAFREQTGRAPRMLTPSQKPYP